jgi:hypothetical protein
MVQVEIILLADWRLFLKDISVDALVRKTEFFFLCWE